MRTAQEDVREKSGTTGSDGNDREPRDFEYQPAGASTVVALGASMLTVVALAPVALVASVGAGAGTAVLGAGLLRGSQRVVTAGGGVALASLVGGAMTSGAVVPVLVGAVGVVVAYDAGRYAVQLGRQVGAEGATLGAEARHLGLTATVSVACGGAGTLIFYAAPEHLPGTAVLVLLIAVVLFVTALSVTDGDTPSVL